MEYVKLLDTHLNSKLLWDELYPILDNNGLTELNQVSLTSVGGNNWTESTGKIKDLKHPERYYSTINQALKGTILETVLSSYKEFYRWRLLRLTPGQTYSIHSDSLNKQTRNIRLHIPLVTNPHSFLCFYDSMPSSGSSSDVKFYHLEENSSYLVDTTGLHTAVNYGTTNRYHIVGVKYENRDNRT